jgi:hypothetical protein
MCVDESAFRHVFQPRLKLAGGWWKEIHAMAMPNLRVARAGYRKNRNWSRN